LKILDFESKDNFVIDHRFHYTNPLIIFPWRPPFCFQSYDCEFISVVKVDYQEYRALFLGFNCLNHKPVCVLSPSETSTNLRISDYSHSSYYSYFLTINIFYNYG